MLAECGLPTIRHRIYARAALAMARYLKSRPNSTLAAHLRHGFQRPPNTRPDGDWVHAMADAARALGVADLVRCDPDLAVPDHFPPPPWAPKTFQVILPSLTHPKQQLPALLHQESLATIAPLSTPATRLYFTDGSAGENGKSGSAFVSGALQRSLRLPDNSSAFQAELVALLSALHHACESPVPEIHLFIDSLSALHSLNATTFKDNVQLLSSTHHQLLILYRLNSDVFLHWVPSHVGLSGNERADEAARIASTAPEVTFPLLPSYAQIKSSVNRAALQASQLLLNDAMEHGSRSATWYITATRQTPHLHLSRFTPPVVRQLVRLRLGFHCFTQILGDDPPPVLPCFAEPQNPLSTTCSTAQHPTQFAI
ncbi:Gag-Pol polyprotein [Chionoecetes opilio]|uniref:Gag-Pol polyprotein n=1 Tax=Chionoecetes opilio TaxID=41210 RepID=A0A8J4Y801_CHIOP|nr:Gag-Pol polyprotein [Chionoecetes opilio]